MILMQQSAILRKRFSDYNQNPNLYSKMSFHVFIMMFVCLCDQSFEINLTLDMKAEKHIKSEKYFFGRHGMNLSPPPSFLHIKYPFYVYLINQFHRKYDDNGISIDRHQIVS
jgi:hypothetical protein